MPPPILNPFLRAFFRSTLPSRCSPSQHHVLLVPPTDVLVSARDRDSNTACADLCSSEEFLESHVLRIPGGVGPNNLVQDPAAFRDSRGKPKQYSTANGRTVIIKDAMIYANKGFKTLNQSQLLSDTIFYPDTFDSQPWLVYYITRPLIGAYEPTPVVPALLPGIQDPKAIVQSNQNATISASSSLGKKKEVKSFGDLLNHFPLIARQMHPGLERLFREFAKELDKPLPPTPGQSSRASARSHRRRSSLSSTDSLPLSMHSSLTYGPDGYMSNLELSPEEEVMRASLETAVTAGIDLFQMVDNNQLSLLGATTDLTGPIVERMIERYITEQVHSSILFPRLCQIRRSDDAELEGRIRQMIDVDISQVGIEIPGGRRGKQELAIRLAKAVDIFKKMGVAGSPQEMLEILLAMQKHLTMPVASADKPNGATTDAESQNEKRNDLLTINADTLVSLLLVVVIRAPVRHLQARLSYMRHFIFIDDVESGEMGYALSTFEAVLSYLQQDANGLRKSSRRNRQLWQATKTGDLETMHSILEPNSSFQMAEFESESQSESEHDDFRPTRRDNFSAKALNEVDVNVKPNYDRLSRASPLRDRGEDGLLAHIFPFQRAKTPPPGVLPKQKKSVTMAVRSMSSSSLYSFRSRTTTDSHATGFEGDTSIETMSKTHGLGGESLLMMAIEGHQDKALQYLLSLTEFYSLKDVLEDCNNQGTTLLSAAVQHEHSRTTDVLLTYLLKNCPNIDVVRSYFAKQDNMGRCVAHYLFHQPHLINSIGHLVPWRSKDKNGKTPVFALCRAWDHSDYREMVEMALVAATQAQADCQPLHLDEHIDNKGNSLLHIIADPFVAIKLLYRCDSDVNAPNDKQFTPLMMASRYGRIEVVKVLFQDARVDLSVRDTRGLTAVELAKDDEVRNRIDDLVLISNPPAPDGRITSVVRSFFVDDGSVRLVVKSAAPSGESCITITSCRRSVQDFENLATWLAQEHPASWLPSLAGLASPYLIPSRPSRSIIRDIQLRLDAFLKTLLLHPTFSTHELVWEFFLVPELNNEMLAARSAKKAETRIEHIRDEYAPLYDIREVETFIHHARENVRAVHHASRSVLRRANKLRNAHTDLIDSAKLANSAYKSLEPPGVLPGKYLDALEKYTKTLAQSEASPLNQFWYAMASISSCIEAVLAQLNRPGIIIDRMSSAQRAADRHRASALRSTKWPLGASLSSSISFLEDSRVRAAKESEMKQEKCEMEVRDLAKELRYTQGVVAGELASWQDGRVREGRRVVREFARRMVVVERARLESMRRAIRGLEIGRKKVPPRPDEIEQVDDRKAGVEEREEMVPWVEPEGARGEDDGETLADSDDEASLSGGELEDFAGHMAPDDMINGDVEATADEPLLASSSSPPPLSGPSIEARQ